MTDNSHEMSQILQLNSKQICGSVSNKLRAAHASVHAAELLLWTRERGVRVRASKVASTANRIFKQNHKPHVLCILSHFTAINRHMQRTAAC